MIDFHYLKSDQKESQKRQKNKLEQFFEQSLKIIIELDSSKIDFLGVSLDLKNDNNTPTENSTQNKNITSKENYLIKKTLDYLFYKKKTC